MVPTNPMEFWAAALTVATLLLAVVAGTGFRSIAVSKKDMEDRNIREAAQSTIKLCVEMSRELLPENNVIMAGLHPRSECGAFCIRAPEEPVRGQHFKHFFDRPNVVGNACCHRWRCLHAVGVFPSVMCGRP